MWGVVRWSPALRAGRHHSLRRLAIAFGGMAVSAALVTACSSAPEESAAPPTTATTHAPSSVASTPTATDSAAFDAVAHVTAYQSALDDLYLDPTLPLDSLHAVSVEPDFLTETSAVADFRAKGYRQDGRRVVVTATANESTGAEPGKASIEVTACIDVSQVRGVDAAGTSIVAADRMPYLMSQLTFVQTAPGDPTSWRVSHGSNAQAASCRS